jgi:hypothetical protein
MYSTKNTEEKVFESKFIEPGVHVVKITAIKGEEPDGYSPRLTISFASEDEKSVEAVFYMSEKAQDMSLRKIKHLATKCIKVSVLDKIEADSLEDYASALFKTLKNKVVRVKFVGEEIEGKEGKNNWVKANIGLPAFAEAVTKGAEHDPVPAESSKLSYDKNNKWDFKPLPTADLENANLEDGNGDDDMPF